MCVILFCHSLWALLEEAWEQRFQCQWSFSVAVVHKTDTSHILYLHHHLLLLLIFLHLLLLPWLHSWVCPRLRLQCKSPGHQLLVRASSEPVLPHWPTPWWRYLIQIGFTTGTHMHTHTRTHMQSSGHWITKILLQRSDNKLASSCSTIICPSKPHDQTIRFFEIFLAQNYQNIVRSFHGFCARRSGCWGTCAVVTDAYRRAWWTVALCFQHSRSLCTCRQREKNSVGFPTCGSERHSQPQVRPTGNIQSRAARSL